jgi:hypothetical protein
MELPPIDHAGWGRLLSAVLADNAGATPEPPVRVVEESEEIARKRAALARTTVHGSSEDVYA